MNWLGRRCVQRRPERSMCASISSCIRVKRNALASKPMPDSWPENFTILRTPLARAASTKAHCVSSIRSSADEIRSAVSTPSSAGPSVCGRVKSATWTSTPCMPLSSSAFSGSRPLGPICDLGCGPGQIARYLHSRGAATCGIDLSREMVVLASRHDPDIRFEQGNMLALDGVGPASFGGIAAFYAVIHIRPEDMVGAFSEMYRVLKPGGVILVTFHLGDEMIHKDEWWGKPVSIDFFFYRTAQVREWLTTAGLEVEEA